MDNRTDFPEPPRASGLADPHTHGLTDSQWNHEGRRRAGEGDLMGRQLGDSQPAHHQRPEGKSRDLAQAQPARVDADAEQAFHFRHQAGSGPIGGPGCVEA